MGDRFDYFVVLAEMRTGSNFLEANLNEIGGLACYGEAYNPHFIGYPNSSDILGVTQSMREQDPLRLIDVMQKKTAGLPGFRYFHDHDPRVFGPIMDDPRCAKIVLTRNPVDSFVSWKIAAETGQWKLTNLKHKRTAQITFDVDAFDKHLAKLQARQVEIQSRLQVSGQTAFYINYEDIRDVDVLNGLAGWLGAEGRLNSLSSKLKKQNPSSLRDKVLNFEEMEMGLARLDHFGLNRTPSFEPRRHAMVPAYVAGADVPLLYMPIKSGPEAQVRAWLAAMDGGDQDGLLTEFSQKSLRQWKRRNTLHRSFTVLRHPVTRAHAAFCDLILATGPGTFGEIRKVLKRVHKVPLPAKVTPDYGPDDHRAAFLAFLHFLKGNLNGQTSVRVDPAWASQTEVLKGLGGFTFPDMVLREDQIKLGLSQLAAQIGREATDWPDDPVKRPVALTSIYDGEIEAAVRDAYQRDYMMFGFGGWAPT